MLFCFSLPKTTSNHGAPERKKTHFYAGAFVNAGQIRWLRVFTRRLFVYLYQTKFISNHYAGVQHGVGGYGRYGRFREGSNGGFGFHSHCTFASFTKFSPFFPKARWNEQFDIKTKRRLKRAFSRYEKIGQYRTNPLLLVPVSQALQGRK